MTKFWENYLKGSDCAIELPKLQQAANFPAQEVTYDVELGVAKSLREFLGERVEDGLLASFAILLALYTGQEDLIIGLPPLLIRLNVDLDQTFSQFLEQIETNIQQIQGTEPPTGISPHVAFQESGLDLSLFCESQGDHLGLKLVCREGLFSQEFLLRMAGNLIELLKGVMKQPNDPIHTVGYVTSDELDEVFRMGRGKKSPYPNDQAVHRLFEENVLKYSDRPALQYEDKTLSYCELNAQANQFARHLKEMGIENGEFVGLAVDRSMDHVIGLLGILKAGGVPVPIDASYPLERKRFMLEDVKAKILVVQSGYRDLFPTEGLKTFCLDIQREELDHYSSENLESTAGPLDLVNINYTSGSTGKPKGVQVVHRGVARLVLNTDWVTVTPEDRMLHMANVSFDAASFEIWGALLNGGCLCIYPHKEFSAEELADFLERKRITHGLFTARLFNLLIEFKLSSLKSLQFLSSAGDVMSVYHAKMALEALPHCAIVNAYGPTENGVVTTAYIARDPNQIDQVIPIGIPIANTDVYILDSHLHPVPLGVAGEIFTGGDGVARGYLNRPEITKERYIPNPFGEGTLYKTGDLGRFWHNGQIEFLGRIDTQVKIRGFRVELGEIEECLRNHPNVGDGVVIARMDQHGDKKLAAYAEPRGDAVLTSDELRSYLESKLIPNMVPAFVVVIPKLPVTPNGKVDRKALPAPEEVIRDEAEFETPDGPTEEMIADIWATLLEIPQVGRKDSFLFLGGDSITSAQMAIMIDQAFNIHVPMGLIFEETTLEKYAKAIKKIIDQHGEKKGRSITMGELFWIWRNRELSLDSAISVERGKVPDDAQFATPKSILLTGATGFVGSFMLKELIDQTQAQITCLVRAGSSEEAKQRLEQALKKYGLWNPEYFKRIIPLLGNLEKPNLGISEQEFNKLAETIDCIYHFGAFVNHSLPYSKLKAANVSGTKEALKLACRGRVKPFHFISTVAVLEPKGNHCLDENEDLLQSKNLINGYAESKWVAEKLAMMARSRNLPVSIYRLGRVSGHSRTGQSNSDDFLWRMAETSIHLGLAPDIGLQENITPVDYVCSAIRTIGSDPRWINGQYHVLNPELFPYKQIYQILQKLGYALEFVPYEKWRRALVEASMETGKTRLQAVAPLFSEIDLSHSDQAVIFGNKNVELALKKKDIVCPHVDEQMIKTSIDALVTKGILPPSELLPSNKMIET